MTAPTPAQVLARESEHVRVRAAGGRVRAIRRLRIIGRFAPQAVYDPADFPGRTRAEIVAGLTVPPCGDPR